MVKVTLSLFGFHFLIWACRAVQSLAKPSSGVARVSSQSDKHREQRSMDFMKRLSMSQGSSEFSPSAAANNEESPVPYEAPETICEHPSSTHDDAKDPEAVCMNT
eukprot:scaffold90928_cov52-Prasinocladus_malaysianus.AAC.2